MKKIFALLGLVASVAVLVPACGDDEEGDGSDGSPPPPPEQTGAQCDAPADCYPEVADKTTIQGDVLCLDRVRGGYCTHTCETTADCCAADGECKTDIAQVCSPFESTDDMMCFLSCEEDDLVPGPGQAEVTDQEYCQREAGPDFICRSSGGGSDNQKVCVPGDCGIGAACSATADCAADLECVAVFTGGYCTQSGCSTNADCPADSYCVTHTDGVNYCLRGCAGDTDCTFCRAFDDTAVCSTGVDYAEAGTNASVCVP